MLGSHFRQQVPIGPYVADFACMAARLIIEIDGSQHGLDSGMRRDAQRTRWLEQQGYRVIRFWNNDVTKNIGSVLEAIYVALYGSLNSDAAPFKHERSRRTIHPTPPAFASLRRRPSPSRGG
jgi:very-short-patch-repair endonuclease